MKVHEYALKTGITRTREFERKGLATHAVNVGIRCGHDCTYCSTPAMLRMHPAFKALGLKPFDRGYAIVDPTIPERVARDARRIKQRGMVQLCTTVDAWSPEARKYNLGRRCLEAIVAEPGWTVRVLTKSAAVVRDFDIIERHRDRVLVGLSITAMPIQERVITAIEPNASPITERIATFREARQRGLRTYAMLCPLLPRVASSPQDVDRLVQLAVECGAEEIFAEPVNPRGPGLQMTQEALSQAHACDAACKAIEIRRREGWSGYALGLIRVLQESSRAHGVIGRLRVLFYSKWLTDEVFNELAQDTTGVIWLGDDPRTEVFPCPC